LVLVLVLPWSLPSGQAKAQDSQSAEEVLMKELRDNPDLFKWVMSLPFRANIFRLTVAAKGMPQALEEYGTDACRKYWNDLFQKPFDKARALHIVDFFNSAIVFVGRAKNGQEAVVAFYNPWVDALFVTEWVGGFNAQKMNRMMLASGDLFRGDPNVIAQTQWQRTQRPAIQGLRLQYSETEDAFNEAYPVLGDYQYLPKRLLSKLEPQAQAQQIILLHARMVARMKTLHEFITEKNNHKILRVKSLWQDAQSAIRKGDRQALSQLIRGDQDQAMLDALFVEGDSARKVRENLSFNGCYTNDWSQALVMLVPNQKPLFFVMLHIGTHRDEGVRLEAVHVYDFSLLRNLTAGGRDKMN
jgi:hypothetical protein